MGTSFTVSRPIIYSKLLTSCVLLVESRPGSLCQRLIAADRFNWSNCGALILCTGKNSPLNTSVSQKAFRFVDRVRLCSVRDGVCISRAPWKLTEVR